MPLEGHYERQTTPLRKLNPRELKAAFGILAITLIALAVIVVLTAGDSRSPVAQGCIRPTVAGITGAETLYDCGQEAVNTCTHASEYTGARAETIVAECDDRGIKF
jgi:hypothetical protein